ncbi:DNA starvation/stationary phase protection protein Dps [Nitrospirillum iridis]|uniref:Starvation-inducible DNA-binding protein n=1 Tax=Nitrospirillum iridis TaxID=765888 RepID=A0A7X0AVZ2_9PROT|nr:DNA starvation/stationary phase protection protein Dps [Nitrospirillum iridis]MBB6251103.1 starvation-inducible DNA-binding protein [Nitrospirillum iridis]
MHPTRNTLPSTVRTRSVDTLNHHLASAIDLHAQVRQARWNVRGANCVALHLLFDRVAARVDGYANLLAGRTAALGGTAHCTVQAAAERSFLLPYHLGVADAPRHLFALSGALASFGQATREAAGNAVEAGDPATADILMEITRGIDQQLWLVESHHAPAAVQPSRFRRLARAMGEGEVGPGGMTALSKPDGSLESWTNEGGPDSAPRP